MLGLTFAQLENIGFGYVLDALEPSSAYGSAALRGLRPFARGQRSELEAELDNIERLARALPRCEASAARLERALMQMRDIRASISRCGREDLSEVELFEIKRYLLQLELIEPLFAEIQAEAAIDGICFHKLAPALELLDPDGGRTATFHISERYSKELAEARRKKREIESLLRSQPENPALLSEQRREAAVCEQNEEAAVCARLSAELEPFAQKMLDNTHAIARLDLTLRKARLAITHGCAKPEITQDTICFDGMTNPKAARELEARGKDFCPVSIELPPGAAVITGANMGGKSMTLKTLALNVLLVQCGIFPFAQAARVCLFDSVHTLSDDLEDSSRGLSSFGGEIAGLNWILSEVDSGFALVILDELARGTNPREGAAIVGAVAGYLQGRNAISVLATHYDGVAGRAGAHFQVTGLANADFAALGEALAAASADRRVEAISGLMDYSLKRVQSDGTPPRDALNICRLLGLDKKILSAAEQMMDS